MSNKKNNGAKKRLTEKQRLEKKKMLLQMENEIKKLEMQIKHSKFTNAKINALKNLKISLRFGQLIAPYIVAAGVTFGGFSIFGEIPFYRDKHKQKLEMVKEFDSLGNIRYEQQYAHYEESEGTISYYSKWTSLPDGLYSRNIKVYSIEDITEETIMKLVNGNNIDSLEEILGEPILRKTETKNNLTDEELSGDSYLQAIMYSESENEYVMVRESVDDNVGFTLLCIILTFFAELITALVRSSTSFDFGDCVSEIKRNHPAIDVEELTKKLEIKRDNYNRLTR